MIQISRIYNTNKIAFLFIFISFVLTVARGCILPYIVIYFSYFYEKDITISGIILSMCSISGIVLSLYSGRLVSLNKGYYTLLLIVIAFFCSLILIAVTKNIYFFSILLISINLFYSCYEIFLKVFFANQSIEKTKKNYFSANYLAVNVGWAVGPFLGALAQPSTSNYFFYLAALFSVIPVCIVASTAKSLGNIKFSPIENVKHPSNINVSPEKTKNTLLIWLTAASFLGTFVYGNPIAYISQYMIQGIHKEAVSHIIAIMMFINATVVIFSQHFIVTMLDRNNISKFIGIGTTCFVVGLLLFWYANDNIFIWCTGMFFFAFGEVIYVPALFIITDYLSPPSARGRYFSVQNLGATGAALSPLIMGFMFNTFSGIFPFIFLAFAILMSCFIIIRVSIIR